MRVANKTIFDSINVNLQRVTEGLSKANTVVSSTKRINQLSDDPVGLVTVLDLRSALAGVDQMGRNIEMGRSWLDSAESALTQVQDILTEVRALTVQMASATEGSAQRANAEPLVDGYLRQILSLANTEVGGRYIFAGTATDTSPFALDNEAAPTAVIYSGNETAFSIKIGKNLTVDVGKNGESIFGASGSSIFDTLINLKESLKNNDIGGIQGTLTTLDENLTNMRTQVSDAGAKSLRLDAKQSILDDMKLNYTDRKSRIEDADIAEAMIDLQERQLAYQATLSSSAKVMEMNLLDYL
jgi:flagellar hook-associated protein 3 FlgL